MGKITRNKGQNLLSISFVLCLVGHMHGIDAGDALPKIEKMSGDVVRWDEVRMGLAAGPDLQDPGAGNLVGSSYERSGCKLWQFVPRGTTEQKLLCIAKLPDDHEAMGRFLIDFAAVNKDGTNGFDAFKDAVRGGNVTLAGLTRIFRDPGRIALFALHEEVFEDIIRDFNPEDLYSLLEEMTKVLRYGGFVQVENIFQAFVKLLNEMQADLAWEIVKKIPVEQLLQMNEFQDVFGRLIRSNRAPYVAAFIRDRMSTEQLLQMDVDRLADSLRMMGHVGAIVGHMKNVDAEQLWGVPQALSILTRLVGVEGQVVIKRITELTKDRFLEMGGTSGLFKELVQNGQDGFVIEQMDKMYPDELPDIDPLYSVLEILADVHQGQFVIKLINRIKGMAGLEAFLQIDGTFGVFCALIRNGQAGFVVDLMEKHPNELLGMDGASRVLVSLVENSQSQIVLKQGAALLQVPKVYRVLVALAKNGQGQFVVDLIKGDPANLLNLINQVLDDDLLETGPACQVLEALAKNRQAEFVESVMKTAPNNLLDMNGAYALLIVLVENGRSEFVADLVKANPDGFLAIPGVYKLLIALAENSRAEFVAGLIKANPDGFLEIRNVCEVLRTLVENGQDQFVLDLIKAKMPLEQVQDIYGTWRVLQALSQKGHPELIEGLMGKDPRELLQMRLAGFVLAELVKKGQWQLVLDQPKEELLQVGEVHRVLVALAENEHNQFVVDLIKADPDNLLWMRGAYNVLEALAKHGQAEFVAGLVKQDSARLLDTDNIGPLIVELAANGQDQFVVDLMKEYRGRLRMTNDSLLLRALAVNGQDRFIMDLVEEGYGGSDSVILRTLVEKGHVDFVADRVRAMSKWQLLQMYDLSQVLDTLAAEGRNDLADEIRRRIAAPKLT